MKLNAEWHKANPMPSKPTFEQRLAWHQEHQKVCGCHPGLPKGLLKEMAKRGITTLDNS